MPNAGVIGGDIVVPAAEGARAALNACSFGLFKNAELPVAWNDRGEYDEPTNTGYDLVPADFLPPFPTEGPLSHLVTEDVEWNPVTTEAQEFVHGWFLYSSALGRVVMAGFHENEVPFVTLSPFKLTVDLQILFNVFPQD